MVTLVETGNSQLKLKVTVFCVRDSWNGREQQTSSGIPEQLDSNG